MCKDEYRVIMDSLGAVGNWAIVGLNFDVLGKQISGVYFLIVFVSLHQCRDITTPYQGIAGGVIWDPTTHHDAASVAQNLSCIDIVLQRAACKCLWGWW